MAKAVIITTCDNCGKDFKITKTCRDAKEKESFEIWAVKNITICYTCLKKINIEQAVEADDVVVERMPYELYKTEWATCKTVPRSYDINTKNIDVVITQKDRAAHSTTKVIQNGKKDNESSMERRD